MPYGGSLLGAHISTQLVRPPQLNICRNGPATIGPQIFRDKTRAWFEKGMIEEINTIHARRNCQRRCWNPRVRNEKWPT